MQATNTLGSEFLGIQFWQNWTKKYYNTKTYDDALSLYEVVQEHKEDQEIEMEDKPPFHQDSSNITDIPDEFANDEQPENSQSILAVKY